MRLDSCTSMIMNRECVLVWWKLLLLLVAVLLSAPSNVTFAFSPVSLLRRATLAHQRPYCIEHSSLWMVDDGGDNKAPTKSKRKRRKRSPRKQHGASPPPSCAKQTWRIFGVNVHPDLLPTDNEKPSKSSTPLKAEKAYLSPPVLQALHSRLRINDDDAKLLDVRVVRRSLDARKTRRPGEESGPRFTYVIDVDVTDHTARQLRFRPQSGRMELVSALEQSTTKRNETSSDTAAATSTTAKSSSESKPRIIIVGAGPAGLFCALTIAKSGLAVPILLERGQTVEMRGRHIGKLMHRRSLDSESNFCFGEGGAGTWSDGKLTTRIGRNSGAVRFVLETLVQYGAPENILVDGAPHLGTDNLVRLLRNMRSDLRDLGGEIRFGAKMRNLVIEDGVVKGVTVDFSEAVKRTSEGVTRSSPSTEATTILGDAVVLATGHSARDVYEELHATGVLLEAKGFAVGFRVEHPQKLINKIQYDVEYGPSVVTGKGVTDRTNLEYFNSLREESDDIHPGRLPVPSYRLATDKADDGSGSRGVYSFCMVGAEERT